jgi:hypothetical protein
VRCGCPDDAVPCKHIAAVLSVFAQRLDEDPWLLLAWHGKDRDALLASLQQDATQPIPSDLPPDPPERALQRLGPLELPDAPADLPERLAELYRQLLAAEDGQDLEGEE